MGLRDTIKDNVNTSKELHYGEKLFMIHYRQAQEDGKLVTVDEIHKNIPMIIKKHTNPLNKNKHDMKAKYLNSTGDFMHLGNVIDIPQKDKSYKRYISITDPYKNEVYSEYKILPLVDDMTFNVGGLVNSKCIIADKGLYDEISYINEQKVFADKDLSAAIVPYNNDTKKLKLFDDVYINDNNYRIVKIDNHTLKEYDEEYGVLQLVVIDVPFGEIKCNKSEVLKGVVMPTIVKDKVLNSISRELLCEHNRVDRGDYITFTYDRDTKGTMVTETYITFNKPVMESGYDKSLLYLCENSINLLNSKGDVVNVPLYFEDNKTRIDKESDGEVARFRNSSYLITLQENETTKKLKGKINRIIINEEVYRIVGFDPLTNGVINFGLELDQFTSDDNRELGVANYYSQMEEINKPKPTVGIVGDDVLYLDYANEYTLDIPGTCTWSIDNSNVKLTDLCNNKCEIYCNKTSESNKRVVLSASLGGTTYEKIITIKI